ncbi:MAG: efflux RND transporter periplasmic adaptor subunit [Vibrio sp.]
MNKKTLLAVGIAFSSLSLYSHATVANTTPAIPVGIQTVDDHDVQQSLTLVAKLVAQESVLIKPEVAGKVSQILVKSNEDVKANQPLLILDTQKAQATLNEARANYHDEQRKENEFSRLLQRNAVTKTELDAQRASVDMAKARMDAALADLSYLNIHAPFAGTIGFISFSKGKIVTASEELFTLDNLDRMRLDLQVPEKYLSKIKLGMDVKTESRAWENQAFMGKLVHIDTRVNEATLSVPIRIDIPNKDHRLKPGMLMSATLTFPKIHKPIIPVQALEYSGTKRYVYVLDGDKVKRTEIVLGARIEDQIVVDSGLDIGVKIVTKGLVNMRDGLAVKVVEDETAQAKKDAEKAIEKQDAAQGAN